MRWYEAIAADVQAAERVVDGERQADERPTRERRALFGGRQRRREVADLLVDDDRVLVIERERGGEGIRVDGAARRFVIRDW